MSIKTRVLYVIAALVYLVLVGVVYLEAISDTQPQVKLVYDVCAVAGLLFVLLAYFEHTVRILKDRRPK